MQQKRWMFAAVAGSLVAAPFAVLADLPDYAPLPPAATPFALPDKPAALLKSPPSPLVTEYQIGFDTRAVDIKQYLRSDSAWGVDSVMLWQTHYAELSDYLTDALAAGRSQAFHRELINQSRLADSTKQNGNKYELPVKIPDWAKKLGLSKPALTLAGSYTLQMKAASHWTNLEEEQGTANKVPDFSPEQIPNINLTGNIGKFISITLTWNQDGFGAAQNQDLHIRYAGEKPEDTEDDVLQELEFGLIQLALPGSSLTGYNEAASGLLGVKGRWRFGDIDLTVVGGTQKGEQQKQHLGRSARDNTSLVRSRDMSLGSEFFLNWDFRRSWNKAGASGRPNLLEPPNLRVFHKVGTSDLNLHPEWKGLVRRVPATIYDSTGRTSTYNNSTPQAWRELTRSTDWYYSEGVVHLLRSDLLGSNSGLAATWTDPRGGSDKNLVLLYADDHEDASLRGLQLRNHYRLPAVSERDRANLRVRILDLNKTKGDPSVDETGVDWTKVFKLAQPGASTIDYNNAEIFNWGTRTLNFPDLEPFRAFGDGAIYDSSRTILSQLSSRFAIEITSKSASDSIKVGGSRDYASVSGSNCIDILPGSEVITLNNSTRLDRGVDYDVQYQTGTITLLSDRARAASNDVQVDFSCTPFFSLENRTVAGARVEYQLPSISKESVLGGTFLYRSETVTDLRPQLGREGNMAMLWGANLRLTGESEDLTDLVSRIPLVKTKADSRWRIELEGAQSWTNPSDQNYALVEDFESAQLGNDFPINRLSWNPSSPPGGVASDVDYEDSLDYRHEGEFTWSTNGQELVKNIYPTHDDGSSSPARQTVMQLRLRPNDQAGRGHSWGGIMRALPSSWRDNSNARYLELVVKATGGELYFDLGKISEDLSIDGKAPNGILNGEDLNAAGEPTGKAQNDYGLDGIPDTSGEAFAHWTCFGRDCQQDRTITRGNGVLDPAADDYVAVTDVTNVNPDHSINGSESNNKFVDGGLGTYFDTEDLDHNGSLDTENSFDRFRIVLGGANQTPFTRLGGSWRLYRIPLDQVYKKKGHGALWNELKSIRLWYGGLSPATNANILEDKVQIARMGLVGNQWKGAERLSGNDKIDTLDATYSKNWSSLTKIVTQDSSRLNVSVIGRSTDNANYVSWGVPEVKDASSGAVQNEQSLRLNYKNLHRGFAGPNPTAHVDSGKAYRLYDSPRDLTLYKNMMMLVYHQTAQSIVDAGNTPVRLGIQFGTGDPTLATSPYYEYAFNPEVALCPDGTALGNCPNERDRAMQNDWQENEINIPLQALTRLKAQRISSGRSDSVFRQYLGPENHPGSDLRKDTISIYGDPSIAKVQWMRLWVRPNPIDKAGQKEITSGEIWVNDIQVQEAHRGEGSALRASAQMNFADLLDISASTEYRGGDFVPMGQKQPSLAQEQSTGRATATSSLYLQKFLPEAWRAQLPVTFTISGGVDRPWSRPGSDMELTRDGVKEIVTDWWNDDMRRDSADLANHTSRAYQTLTVSRTLSSSWTRGRDEGPGWGPFLTNTFFSRPKVGWSYTEQGNIGPDRRDTTWAHQLKLDYDFSPPPPPQLKPFGTATGKWVPEFVKNFTVQPWPSSITSTLGDLDYLEGNHAQLAPDKDSLPRLWTMDRRANLGHSLNADWQFLDFLRVGMGTRSSRLWDRVDEAGVFDPSTGLVDAMPLIFDWDTTHVHTTAAEGGDLKRQSFLFLRNENGRNLTFNMDLSPRILPWLTTSGTYQANATANREASIQRAIVENGHVDTTMQQFWRHDHTDNFHSSLRLDVPSILRSLQGVLPDSWSKPLEETRQGLDRWRWTGFGFDYSVDDRISGVRQTLDYSSAREELDAGSLVRWQSGLGDADGFRSPLDLVTGSRSKSGFGQYRPSRLESRANYPGVNDTNPSESGADRTGMVNTRSYRISTNTEFTVPGLLLSVQPSLAYQISWDERWAVPWSVDTTRTWPQITINANLANFAGRVPFLTPWFDNATASHSTTWELSQQIHPHILSADVDNYTWRWQPLVGLQLKTKGNWSFEDRTNFSRTRSLNHLKQPSAATDTKPIGACPDDMGYPLYLTDPAILQARCFEVVGTSEDRSYDVGNEGTATYRIQTKRGFQLFRWFIKLDNDLVVTFKAGWTHQWKERDAIDLGLYTPLPTQTLEDVTTVYGGSNASYNFTSKLVATFDASYRRTERQVQPDDPTNAAVTNDISFLASLQYKF